MPVVDVFVWHNGCQCKVIQIKLRFMKRTITLLFLLSAILTAKAHHLNSSLNLHLQNSSFFTVIFDNRNYPQPVSVFSLNDIEPGCHYITIYKMKPQGYYHAYPLIVYSGKIEIPEASVINATVSNHNLRITDIFPVCPSVPVANVPCHPSGYYAMSEQEFRDLKYIINKKSFDSSRLAIAKDAVRNNPMSSRQISELLDVFSFDSSKLEFAKYAYRYVADPSSYYLTYDQFTFESSVTELIDYINRNS
jgi:hypothetical protein